MIHIYECDNSFLYEIIEDYKEAETEKEKNKLFDLFISSIWSSPNKRRIYTKYIRFNVRKDLLNTKIGQVFDAWSEIEYKYYKSMTKDKDWCSVIRQKVNNMYTRYFDKEVILDKEYMDLLKTPKRLYYQWISGIEMNTETVTEIIDDSIDNALKIKNKLSHEKMELSWNEYKKIVEDFLRKCFDNCKLIEEYEKKKNLAYMSDFFIEDNFYIGYFCKSLEGEMLKWQKKYYSVRDHKKYIRCKQCGAMIEKTNNRVLYCKKCYISINQKDAKNRMKKYRNKNVTF